MKLIEPKYQELLAGGGALITRLRYGIPGGTSTLWVLHPPFLADLPLAQSSTTQVLYSTLTTKKNEGPITQVWGCQWVSTYFGRGLLIIIMLNIFAQAYWSSFIEVSTILPIVSTNVKLIVVSKKFILFIVAYQKHQSQYYLIIH